MAMRNNGLWWVAGAALLLGGCASGPISNLSTAASMRVEVEVYKGPLSGEYETQMAELIGMAEEARYGFGLFSKAVQCYLGTALVSADDRELVGRRQGYSHLSQVPDDKRDEIDKVAKRLAQARISGCKLADGWKKSLKEPLVPGYYWGFWDDSGYFIGGEAPEALAETSRLQLSGIAQDAQFLSELLKRDVLECAVNCESRNSDWSSTKSCSCDPGAVRKQLLFSVSRFSSRATGKAFFWAENQIGSRATPASARRLIADFANMTSAYANQLSSRASVLAKESDADGKVLRNGSQLAISDHLRDASPTDFVHLYDWLDGTLYPLDNFGPSRPTPADRVRIAQRLFDNHYWAKINEVYSSGQGEFATVLVKDDIGNWNIKSFDSDPTELLDTYRAATMAGVYAGAEVVKTLKSGGASAALEMARDFSSDGLMAGKVLDHRNQALDSVRRQAVDELRAIADELEADDKLQQALDQADGAKAELTEAATAADDARQEAEAKRAAAMAVDDQLIAAQGDLVQARDRRDGLRDRLNDYDDRIEQAKQAVADAVAAGNDATDANLQLGRLQGERQALNDRLTDAGSAVTTAEGKVTELQGKKSDAAAALTSAEAEAESKEQARETASAAHRQAADAADALVDDAVRRANTAMAVHRRVLDTIKSAYVPGN